MLKEEGVELFAGDVVVGAFTAFVVLLGVLDADGLEVEPVPVGVIEAVPVEVRLEVVELEGAWVAGPMEKLFEVAKTSLMLPIFTA